MAFITGSRKQISFLPPKIEDYVGKEDPVRVYDAFIESIDLLWSLGTRNEKIPIKKRKMLTCCKRWRRLIK